MLFKAALAIGFALFLAVNLVKSDQEAKPLLSEDMNQSNQTSNATTTNGTDFLFGELEKQLNESDFVDPQKSNTSSAASQGVKLAEKNETMQTIDNPAANETRSDNGLKKIKEIYQGLQEQLKAAKNKLLRKKILEAPSLPRNTSRFSIPRNMSEEGCLKLDVVMKIVITYPTMTNETAEFELNVESTDYQGQCGESMDKIVITVPDFDWNIGMEYTKDPSDSTTYRLSGMSLNYIVSQELFQNVSESFVGVRNASTPGDFSRFEGKIGQSYLCDQQSVIALDKNVRFVFDFYQAQPFNKKREFDSAIICGEDDHEFSIKFPLLIGIGLILTVVVIFVIYKYFNFPNGFERLRLEPVNSRYT